MSVMFEVMVPNDDEGYSLGAVTADALPRKGERFCIDHPALQNREQRRKRDPFIGVVDEVLFNVEHDHKTGEMLQADIRVWLVEEHHASTIYCVCTDEERNGIVTKDDLLAEEETGECFHCGKTRP
jgi:hypothetical protein